MSFLSGLAAKLIQWAIEKIAPLIIKGFKRLVRNAKINSEVNDEVKAVKEAVEEAKKSLKENDELEKRGKRLGPAQEKRLRESVRKLSNIFD